MNKRTSVWVCSAFFLTTFLFTVSQSSAELSVYDNDGQYLGVLIQTDSMNGAQIFIPSTGKFCWLKPSEDTPEHCYLGVLPQWFETDDCTGQSYLWRPYLYTYPWIGKTCKGSYLTAGKIKVITPRSEIRPPDCECVQITEPEAASFIELITASPPPFTLPVSLPFRYESSVKCDVTGDGNVNVGDALQVFREALGLRPNGCCQ